MHLTGYPAIRENRENDEKQIPCREKSVNLIKRKISAKNQGISLWRLKNVKTF
jgi:hypothetical protein